MVDFGDRLKKLRKQKHITQSQLAERIGVTKAMVSAYETGMRSPSHDIFVRIARDMGVSTDYLYGLTENRVIDVTGVPDKQVEILAILVDELRKKP